MLSLGGPTFKKKKCLPGFGQGYVDLKRLENDPDFRTHFFISRIDRGLAIEDQLKDSGHGLRVEIRAQDVKG